MLEQAQATCRQLLKANRVQLDALAQRLLEREVVSGDELKGLLGARVNTLNHRSIADARDDPYSPHAADTADRAA